MTDPNRILPPFVELPTHSRGVKPCMVCTDLSVSTVSLGDGHYAAVVANQIEAPVAAVMLFNLEEAKAHIALLQLALDDVERLYAGKQPLAALAVRTTQ